jgi:F420-dependent NADP oxidoreductase-like protein
MAPNDPGTQSPATHRGPVPRRRSSACSAINFGRLLRMGPRGELLRGTYLRISLPKSLPQHTHGTTEMTTAIIGSGNIGSAVARQLAAAGEAVRLASTHAGTARDVAERIGANATAWSTNRDAVQSATLTASREAQDRPEPGRWPRIR